MDELKLSFTDKLPSTSEFKKSALLIYDSVLEKKHQQWIKKFPLRYKVQSGEKLKALDQLPTHLKKISVLIADQSPKDIHIVAFGGGSVGDFAGFIASIFKRGVALSHIPSTWLAALDSAHGGKTALNVGAIKNQVGSFYPAQSIYLCKDVLFSQPVVRAHEAFSELLKMALLEGGPLWQGVQQISDLSHQAIWSQLGPAIEAKYRVVAQDPYEETGYRHLLNLGHTLGHAIEGKHHVPHGIAVNLGLHFALLWSADRGYMGEEVAKQIHESPAGQWLIDLAPFLTAKDIKAYKDFLLKDKKKTSLSKLRFIFLQAPGEPVIEEISVTELLNFATSLAKKFEQ